MKNVLWIICPLLKGPSLFVVWNRTRRIRADGSSSYWLYRPCDDGNGNSCWTPSGKDRNCFCIQPTRWDGKWWANWNR